MAQLANKMFSLCVVVCLITLCVGQRPAAGAEDQLGGRTLQPQGLNYAGIYALREMDPNLTGSGIKFAVICRSLTYIDGEPQNDYRPSTKHNCFKTEQFSFHDQGQLPAGISPHSTAICSVLLGEDPNAFSTRLGQFYYQGTAPAARADIYEFWHFLINNVFPGLPPDADVITASVGGQFENWWTRGIESMAEQYGLVVVAGIGNGSNANDPLLYPGAGTNVIGIGVIDSVNTGDLATNLAHFSLAHPEHSSFGPTGDGRCKPDIVAIGNCLAADDDEPNRYEATGNWSSFSTPLIAGTVGLLVQKAKQDPNLSSAVSPDGGNCVIKAILLNSAKKLPYWHKGRLEKDDDHTVPLDYIQGAGALNAGEAYKHLIAGAYGPGDVPTTGWDLNQLQEGKKRENVYKITITEPADKFITATVVWNKHYNSTYPFEPLPEKDANLRLELWGVEPNDPNNNNLLDYSDSTVDNVEHIYTQGDANYANYEIVVLSSHSDEPNQIPTAERYGLAWLVRRSFSEGGNVSNKQDLVRRSGSEDGSNNIFWYDLNADGVVDKLDVIALFDNMITRLKSPESYLLGDINADGAIDVNDLQILIEHRNLKADWYVE